MSALAGDDLVHPVHVVPGDQARLALEPCMADGPERDALARDGDFDPLDEEAVEEQADAEGKAAAHGDRERRERAAVRLRDLDNGKDEAQRAHGTRTDGPA